MPQKTNTTLRAACSVTQMAAMVGLSRARFYELMHEGIFCKPQYSTRNRRPFFTREAQEANIGVRRDQIGMNGEYVLFYERSEPSSDKPKHKPNSGSNEDALSGFVSQLKGLGMTAVNSKHVAQAIRECFPEGMPDGQDADVLRTIYRYLRRTNDV